MNLLGVYFLFLFILLALIYLCYISNSVSFFVVSLSGSLFFPQKTCIRILYSNVPVLINVCEVLLLFFMFMDPLVITVKNMILRKNESYSSLEICK